MRVLLAILLAACAVAAFEGADADGGTFDSPLGGGRMLWEFASQWGSPDWTLMVHWSVREDVDGHRYVLAVNRDLSGGLVWESEACTGGGCLSNYWYNLDALGSWGFGPGDAVRLDLYQADGPPPWDLLHLGTLETTVPTRGKAGYPDVFESAWREADNTIVSTFTVTAVDGPATTLEIRRPGFQWVPEDRRPVVTNEFPHACSFDWPSGEMRGWGCVGSRFSSDETPFTAVLTVTAVAPLHTLYMGESHRTTCTVAAFESDGRAHWYLGNLWAQMYCGPVPPAAFLPMVAREGGGE